MSWRLVKSLIPPCITELYKAWSPRHLRLTDGPTSWHEALSKSTGYSLSEICRRAVESARGVVNGSAKYERDTVLFNDDGLPLHVLSALLRAASLNQGRLQVLDFGGSLGSTYFQSRRFLDGLKTIDWRVVEQPAFAEAGRAEFGNSELAFFSALEDAIPLSPNSIFLLCSVLQYLEAPDGLLRDVARTSARHLVIDRTPVHDVDDQHRLYVQRVPSQIYAASYPCWVLSRRSLLNTLADDWSLVTEYTCEEGASMTRDGLRFMFKGLILERKPC